MNTTFSFKILHNLLSCYTSGPGPSGIAWQHLLEFSRPILRHTPRCSKNKLLILETSKKLKDEMLWGKQNYNQTTETQTSRIKIVDLMHSSQCRYWKRKIVIFKITGISLEFILIYTFAGLLTILGAVLLAVCISQYRKKRNQTSKRYVGTIRFKNSSFPSFQKMQYIPNIPVHLPPPEPCSLFWPLEYISFVFYIIHSCRRAHHGEAARRNATSKKIWLPSDTFVPPFFSNLINNISVLVFEIQSNLN